MTSPSRRKRPTTHASNRAAKNEPAVRPSRSNGRFSPAANLAAWLRRTAMGLTSTALLGMTVTSAEAADGYPSFSRSSTTRAAASNTRSRESDQLNWRKPKTGAASKPKSTSSANSQRPTYRREVVEQEIRLTQATSEPTDAPIVLNAANADEPRVTTTAAEGEESVLVRKDGSRRTAQAQPKPGPSDDLRDILGPEDTKPPSEQKKSPLDPPPERPTKPLPEDDLKPAPPKKEESKPMLEDPNPSMKKPETKKDDTVKPDPAPPEATKPDKAPPSPIKPDDARPIPEAPPERKPADDTGVGRRGQRTAEDCDREEAERKRYLLGGGTDSSKEANIGDLRYCEDATKELRQSRVANLNVNISPLHPSKRDSIGAQNVKPEEPCDRDWHDYSGKVIFRGRPLDYDVTTNTGTFVLDNGQERKVSMRDLHREDVGHFAMMFKVPVECELDRVPFKPRSWACSTFAWKAVASCHKPIYWEDEHLERYGHSFGPVRQPLVSAFHFFGTFPVLPYKMGLTPPNECIYTLGYYRPGNCAPYMLDPIPLSVRAAMWEAGAWVGGVAIIP